MSKELVKKFMDALVADDWDTVKDMYADDCVFEEVPTGQVFNGVEENLQNDQQWKSIISDMKPTFDNIIEAGNNVSCEMTMVATMTGEMEMPDGTKVPPTNKTANVKLCFISEWNGGKMSKGSMYWDMMTFMQQIGVMPA